MTFKKYWIIIVNLLSKANERANECCTTNNTYNEAVLNLIFSLLFAQRTEWMIYVCDKTYNYVFVSINMGESATTLWWWTRVRQHPKSESCSVRVYYFDAHVCLWLMHMRGRRQYRQPRPRCVNVRAPLSSEQNVCVCVWLWMDSIHSCVHRLWSMIDCVAQSCDVIDDKLLRIQSFRINQQSASVNCIGVDMNTVYLLGPIAWQIRSIVDNERSAHVRFHIILIVRSEFCGSFMVSNMEAQDRSMDIGRQIHPKRL